MKDWLFYPLAACFIAGMIWYALSLAEYDSGPRQSGFTVEGETLSTLYAAEGLTFSIAGDASNPNAYAVLTAYMSRKLAPPSAGIFLTLGPQEEKAYAGQNLRITVRARRGRASPSSQFDVQYFTNGAGQSGWKTFELGNNFQDFSFEYKPNLPVKDPGNNYLGIWPDVGGDNRTMDVEKITLEVLPAQE